MAIFRQVKPDDWLQINELVATVFQESLPMSQSFPFLFSESNTYSYVAVEEAVIIGFIGVLPEMLMTAEQSYTGMRIGAVCIANDYQGRGIGRSLFRLLHQESREAGLDFILISGQGKLYLQEGAELFGQFNHYLLETKEVSQEVSLSVYDGQLRDLINLTTLLQAKSSYYVASLKDYQVLLNAQALANLFGGQQQIYFGKKAGETLAVLVLASRQEGNTRLNEVLEYGGQPDVLVEMLSQLANPKEAVSIRVSLDSKLAVLLAERAKLLGQENNAGTIVYLNEQVRSCDFPHTWDLAFL